jgi:hypothetical protein
MKLFFIAPLARCVALLLLAGGGAARAQNLAFHTNQPPLQVGASPTCVIAADVNGDGLVDLVTADNGTNTLTVLTNSGQGVFALGTNVTVGDNPYCVAAADLNGDGKMDLVCANLGDGTVTVLTNSGQVLLTQPALVAATGFEVTLSGTIGRTNVIEVSSDLLNWAPLLTNVNVTNFPWRFTDAVTNLPRRFYRAITP